jgi:hypothetical protein
MEGQLLGLQSLVRNPSRRRSEERHEEIKIQKVNELKAAWRRECLRHILKNRMELDDTQHILDRYSPAIQKTLYGALLNVAVSWLELKIGIWEVLTPKIRDI